MTKDKVRSTEEALKLALEHFETWTHEDSIFAGEFDKEITAIKEALAQPEQEPRCEAIIEVFGKDWRLDYMSLPVGKHKLYTQQYTYTTPPQRKPLTDEEIGAILEDINAFGTRLYTFARSIEAKLKEKNK